MASNFILFSLNPHVNLLDINKVQTLSSCIGVCLNTDTVFFIIQCTIYRYETNGLFVSQWFRCPLTIWMIFLSMNCCFKKLCSAYNLQIYHNRVTCWLHAWTIHVPLFRTITDHFQPARLFPSHAERSSFVLIICRVQLRFLSIFAVVTGCSKFINVLFLFASRGIYFMFVFS